MKTDTPSKFSVERDSARCIVNQYSADVHYSLVCDKAGFVISRIELLAYLTTFDMDKRSGNIPIDVSLFSKKGFSRAMNIMVKIYEAGLSVTDLVAVATEGERLGEVVVPQGKIGLATVASVVINGAFLIAGIPIASCFGGILQMRNHEPLRFVDLVEYDGSTLDPFEIFIAGRMTEVDGASKQGAGKILASFHEIPMPSSPAALEIINGLKEAELCNWLIVGKPNGLVCEMPARLNHVGLLLPSALNPVAAVAEAGVEVTCRTMSGVIDVERLKNFRNI